MKNTQKIEHAVLLTIKQEWADKIINGKKTIELRKDFVEDLPSGTKMFLCIDDIITAVVDIDKIEKLKIEKIKTLKDKHCAEDDWVDNYFKGYDKGYTIHISNIAEFVKPDRPFVYHEGRLEGLHIYDLGFQTPHSFQVVPIDKIKKCFFEKEKNKRELRLTLMKQEQKRIDTLKTIFGITE